MVNFPAYHVKVRGDKTIPYLTFAIVLMLRYAPGQDSVLECIEVHSLKLADISPLKIDLLCPQKAGFIFQLLIFRDKNDYVTMLVSVALKYFLTIAMVFCDFGFWQFFGAQPTEDAN